MNRLAGVAYLSVDGRSFPVTAHSWNPARSNRKALSGQDGLHGYSEEPGPGVIKATIRDSADMSMAAFEAMTNVTVVLELANGKVIIGRNMFTVDPQEVDGAEATRQVTWNGPDVTEN